MLRRNVPTGVARGERGQYLVLFVVMFSLIIGMAAFSIDQGVWLGKRRISQKDADASARAGASIFLDDPYNGASAAAAEGRAEDWALGNLADINASLTDFRALADCTTYDGTVYDDVPSVEADINAPTGGLFSSLFGVGGLDDLGATATACVGAPDEAQGIDPFFIAPDSDRPLPPCFDANGLPDLGKICAIMGPAHFQDLGQRGSLTLQDDPTQDPFPNNETQCTEPSTTHQPGEIVQGSGAICRVGDEVHTDGGTFNNHDPEIRCRILGWQTGAASGTNPDGRGAGNDCPNGYRSASAAPGEGFCDADYHLSATTIPPTPGSWDPDDYDPPFLPADVFNSPSGVDDFEEVFSKPDGSAPDSLTDTAFLIPNICSNGKQSPRIFTIVLAEAAVSKSGPCAEITANGCVVIDQFAMFYVIGCRNVDGPGSFNFTGRIDPFCDGASPDTYDPKINGARTALVGVFVKALLPSGGGPLDSCDPDGVISCSIVLVK